jgi:glucose/arabinose dehydrogenase
LSDLSLCILLCVLLCTLTLALTMFSGQINYNNSAYASDRPFGEERGSSHPVINDPNLKLELVSEGIQLPTQMNFIGPNDILVLEKDNGMVKRIVNGIILEEPVLDANVATAYERGLLGIAIAENDSDSDNKNDATQRNSNIVYLYYTESEQDANDECSSTVSCSKENEPLGNRLYRYELVDNELVNPKLLLDLPTSSGASHNGGSLLIGPDKNIYLPMGEGGYMEGQISNNDDGSPPDGRGGILRVSQQTVAIETRQAVTIETQAGGDGEDDEDNGNENDKDNGIDGILGDEDPLNKYYAYGIRNSFGIDFDPVSGKLWDTENGPGYGDEINLVEPGFNSGWGKVQGIWKQEDYFGGPVAPEEPDDLVDFDGKGKYSDPEFTWKQTVGVTSIKFLDSDKLGKDFQNDMFVGDINNGNLYHFDLNEDRDQLLLDDPLKDRIANNQDELQKVILGHGFNGITDIEVGPDGYLYVLSYAGEIFRISSKG